MTELCKRDIVRLIAGIVAILYVLGRIGGMIEANEQLDYLVVGGAAVFLFGERILQARKG